MTTRVSLGLYDWCEAPLEDVRDVRLEYDVREALQAFGTRRPDPRALAQLMQTSVGVGIDLLFLGFPGAGATEFRDLSIQVDELRGAGVTLVVMARARTADVGRVADLSDATGTSLVADIFVSTSALRTTVDGVTLDANLDALTAACKEADRLGVPFRVAFEDSSRTSPDALARCLERVADLGPQSVVLNDTTGACTPWAAEAHVRFAKEWLASRGHDVCLAWHGHNDTGLALANSIAAMKAGVSEVSGTFGGLGERAGNLALEQMIWLLDRHSSRSFPLEVLPTIAHRIEALMGQATAPNAPIVGAEVFSTATGTHAAALLKARELGSEAVDLLYSDVLAGDLGLKQSFGIGPNSGANLIREALTQVGVSPTPDAVEAAVRWAKELRSNQSLDSVKQVFARDSGISDLGAPS